jgi:hypothetical protein
VITFLTTAKPFVGGADVRQMNAIRSWRAIAPEAEILLFGNGQGYDYAASSLGLTHIPAVACNEHGIPRVDAMFEEAACRGRFSIKAYLNCDIMLTGSVTRAMNQISCDRFLMVAQRWNLDVDEAIDFRRSDWEEKIVERVRMQGYLFTPAGIDAFFWKGQVWGSLPPMVVGRGKYDNWMIYYCRSQGVPVVDATDAAMIIHQNHDYSHVQGGKDEVMDGSEALRNLSLGGGDAHLFTISDADRRLTRTGLTIRNRCRGDSRRCVEVFSILHPDSVLARSTIGRFLLQVGYEGVERFNHAKQGDVKPLFKLVPWFLCRLLKCR